MEESLMLKEIEKTLEASFQGGMKVLIGESMNTPIATHSFPIIFNMYGDPVLSHVEKAMLMQEIQVASDKQRDIMKEGALLQVDSDYILGSDDYVSFINKFYEPFLITKKKFATNDIKNFFKNIIEFGYTKSCEMKKHLFGVYGIHPKTKNMFISYVFNNSVKHFQINIINNVSVTSVTPADPNDGENIIGLLVNEVFEENVINFKLEPIEEVVNTMYSIVKHLPDKNNQVSDD